MKRKATHLSILLGGSVDGGGGGKGDSIEDGGDFGVVDDAGREKRGRTGCQL